MMGQSLLLTLTVPAALAAGISALGARAALVYGRQRLLDQPGFRRSHRVPTPRGGGVGIVFAVSLAGLLPLLTKDPLAMGTAAIALVLVAGVGWIDDHRNLSPWHRLSVHMLASALAVVVPVAVLLLRIDIKALPGMVLLIPLALVLVWSINLHNFMDGINGLLTLQSVFVLSALAALALRSGHGDTARLAVVGAVAGLGFLPFNFPRARIFLGDVGSGTLGFLIGWLSLRAVAEKSIDSGVALMLSSVFLVDATFTLLSRFLRGRRWWQPHREHLYQWLVRTGRSHPRVVAFYLGFNLLVVLPLVWVHETWFRPSADPAIPLQYLFYAYTAPLITLLLAAGLWLFGKQHCLIRASNNSMLCRLAR